MASWTIPRLVSLTVECQRRMIELFHMAGMTHFNERSIGIWYGCDKASRNPGHYPGVERAHGVHTLMKGLATRLEVLVEQTDAPVIILMEGDCWPVPSFPRIMEIIEKKLERERFVWMGFFLNTRPNKNDSAEARRVRTTRVRQAQQPPRPASSIVMPGSSL